ncbi:unnamed protein product [marine sediment metagenome]|uniref:Uncharacterized protein n=1 Tax=marine sediment metagenome TaxID=412755 RepID=X1DLQ2_9ZZZZ
MVRKIENKTIEDIRRQNREGHLRFYGKSNPTAPISREVRGFLSKKESLSQGEKGRESLLLVELMEKIRVILTVDSKKGEK